jgi:hypothetical protein
VGPDANMSMEPFAVDTIAMFDVMAPSSAFSVEINGCGVPYGHIDRYPSTPVGTTVALNT